MEELEKLCVWKDYSIYISNTYEGIRMDDIEKCVSCLGVSSKDKCRFYLVKSDVHRINGDYR